MTFESPLDGAPGVCESLDILCFSHLRWDFVTQRPQHLLSRAARTRRVFYWEEPFVHRQGELPPQANALAPVQGGPTDARALFALEAMKHGNVTVLRPHVVNSLTAAEVAQAQCKMLRMFCASYQVDAYVAWYYTPMAMSFSASLKPSVTVYDCMDELSLFHGASPELRRWEQQLLTEADVVFTGGRSLYEAKRTQHANVHAFPSSIDVQHFAAARSATNTACEPKDQTSIPFPRAGFYGVLDERLDLALLRKVAAILPEVHFVLIGPVVKIDAATLPQAENIHYLGQKTYAELPKYLAGWQVALMPFAMNEATRFISPTKTPEYLAAGKPVVSTPVRDVVLDYGAPGLAAIARTPEEFANAIRAALLPQGDRWLDAVDAKLAQTSWDRTWVAMEAEIGRANAKNASLRENASRRIVTADLELRTPGRVWHRDRYDYVIAGAGFAGSVLAERLATVLHKRVLIVDKRTHVGGNTYDYYNAAGILVHQYGPHIFHTNSEKVFKYLSRFTEWRPYEHYVLAKLQDKHLPFPINIDTINQRYGLNLDSDGMRAFLADRAIASPAIRTSKDLVLSRVGQDLYENFFQNYTRKQWGLDPSELDASVAGRIPVRFDHDARYFTDVFQAMPLDGYTAMFERMLDHPNITVQLGTEFTDVMGRQLADKVVFTGPIDEFFRFRFGPLPYRSLDFRHETYDREIFQPAPVVNFPNDHEYTRITEFKYLTGQKHPKTSVVYEYPRANGDPYYPIPRPENTVIYEKYKALAVRQENVTFCGRLANYKYFNMDQVVAQALTTFEGMAAKEQLVPASFTAAALAEAGVPA